MINVFVTDPPACVDDITTDVINFRRWNVNKLFFKIDVPQSHIGKKSMGCSQLFCEGIILECTDPTDPFSLVFLLAVGLHIHVITTLQTSLKTKMLIQTVF